MTTECWHLVLAAATVVGAALALVGVVRTVTGAYASLRASVFRYGQAVRLSNLEKREMREAQAANPQGFDSAAIRHASAARHRAAGLARATYDNQVYLGIYEAHRVLRDAFRAARANLAVTAGGLLLSTAAGVAGLLWP